MFGYNDTVKHKPTGLLYIIDYSSGGIRYSDKKKYWYNVAQVYTGVGCMEDTLFAKKIILTALPENDLKIHRQHPLNKVYK